MWIPPRALREAREFLRPRAELTGIRTGVKHRLWALVARRTRAPTAAKTWMTIAGQRELQALVLGPGECLTGGHENLTRPTRLEMFPTLSDFPHPDGVWPDPQEFIRKELGHLPAPIRRAVVCDNAAQLYGFRQDGGRE